MRIRNNNSFLLISSLSLLLILSILLLTSCGGPTPVPGSFSPLPNEGGILITHKIKSKLDISRYKRVLMAGYSVSSTNSLDLKTIAYEMLRQELSKNASFLFIYEKPLEIEKTSIKSAEKNIELKSEDIFNDTEIWKKIAQIYNADLIMTGDISLTSEVRTSVEKRTRFQEGKENVISKLVELKFFKLDFTVYFIDGLTGKTVHSEKLSKEKGFGTTSEESKSIFLGLLKDAIPDLRSIIIAEREPVQRFILG